MVPPLGIQQAPPHGAEHAHTLPVRILLVAFLPLRRGHLLLETIALVSQLLLPVRLDVGVSVLQTLLAGAVVEQEYLALLPAVDQCASPPRGNALLLLSENAVLPEGVYHQCHFSGLR